MRNPKPKGYIPDKAPLLHGIKKVGDEVYAPVPGRRATTHLSYLGRGRFTTAFRLVGTRSVVLYTFYEDFSKSILSQAYREYGKVNVHLPKIKRIGRQQFKQGVANVYLAHYYKPVTDLDNLSQKNKDMILRLQELQDTAQNAFSGDVVRSGKASLFNFIIIRGKGLGYSMKMALEHLAYTSEDWGDHYLFDSFKLPNWGLDGKNNLILVDPMFDMEKIQRDHDVRIKHKLS